ncbi:PIN domain-containing protein [archaeon]|nr:PIN domain-containing protein [archaeon]
MFLDTSILIDLIRKDAAVAGYMKKVVEREPLYSSIIQVGEVADWCYLNDLDPTTALSWLGKMCYFTDLTEDICLEGSRIKQKQRKAGKNKFSLIDGFIASSAASSEQKLLTKDRDFDGLENVIVL